MASEYLTKCQTAVGTGVVGNNKSNKILYQDSSNKILYQGTSNKTLHQDYSNKIYSDCMSAPDQVRAASV